MSTELDHNIDGIACKELHGSNVGEFSFDTSQVTRIFRCAWGDRLSLAEALLGSTTVDESGTTVQIPPKTHPEIPSLYVRRVVVEQLDSSVKGVVASGTDLNTEAMSYTDARLTATYEPFVAEFNPGDQLITEEFDVSMEVLEIEGGGYVYQGTSIGVAQKMHKVIGQVEDQIIFHRSASNKRATIKSLVGRVNDAALADADRGSMLFLGGRGRRTILTNGTEMWELGYRFRSRKTDDTSNVDEWQKVFRIGTGWQKVVQAHDSNSSVYAYGDFSPLFT